MTDCTEQGLIVAYLLDGRGGGRRLQWGELGEPVPLGHTLWVHLDRECQGVHDWLRQNSGLTSLAVESLLAESTRPHCTAIDDGALLFLRAVNLNPGADPDDMVSIRLWVDQNRVISVRKRRLLSVDDLRANIEAGRGPKDPAGFLMALSARIGSRVSEVVEDIDDKVDELQEQSLDSGANARLRAQLTEIRRQIISLRRYLAPQRDALNRLAQLRLAWLDELEVLHVREEADRVTRFVEDLDSARERAAVTQEELSNRINEQMNARMYVLSVVAAVFLPLGFLTGLFGINVGGIPLAEDPWGFVEITLLLAAITGL